MTWRRRSASLEGPTNSVDDHAGQNESRGDSTRAWMAAHHAELNRQCRNWRSSEIRWSWGRLAAFCAAVAAVYAFRENVTAALVLLIPCLFLFALAVWRHRAAACLREFGERQVQMAAESLGRCGGRLVVIRDSTRPSAAADAACNLPSLIACARTAPLGAQELDDLDIYARPVGVFGLLNRTSTALGARRLRELIERPCLSEDSILARQRLVKWLADNPTGRPRIMAAASRLRRQDDRLDAFVETHARDYHFQEDLTDSGPVFDYRLRCGPATTRNALLILEREGYPAGLLDRARAYLQETNEPA